MTDTPAMPLVRTPLDLRALAEPAMKAFGQFSAGAPLTGKVHENVQLQVDGHPATTADIIEPPTPGPHPVLLYVHGGGWVCGDLPDFRQLASRLAERGLLVINVRYGLAPEEPFPAGHNHVVTAATWALANAESFGGDARQLFIAGDSAGANIAAGVCVGTELPIKAAALMYGVYDMATMPTTPGVHHEDFLHNLHLAYLGDDVPAGLRDPRVSPLHAAAEMPPTLLLVGADDPLVSESDAFSAAMAAEDVPHEYKVLPALNHGFLHLETSPGVLESLDAIASFLHAQVAAT